MEALHAYPISLSSLGSEGTMDNEEWITCTPSNCVGPTGNERLGWQISDASADRSEKCSEMQPEKLKVYRCMREWRVTFLRRLPNFHPQPLRIDRDVRRKKIIGPAHIPLGRVI
jgi:hypothetical protein